MIDNKTAVKVLLCEMVIKAEDVKTQSEIEVLTSDIAERITKLFAKPNKKNRYYFRNDDNYCHTINWHLEYMIENDIKEMNVFLAKRIFDNGYFFCKFFDCFGEKSGGGCGKMCEGYKPRNGKSGICQYNGYVYEQSGEFITLKL
jgi:hypothetical protein